MHAFLYIAMRMRHKVASTAASGCMLEVQGMAAAPKPALSVSKHSLVPFMSELSANIVINHHCRISYCVV